MGIYGKNAWDIAFDQWQGWTLKLKKGRAHSLSLSPSFYLPPHSPSPTCCHSLSHSCSTISLALTWISFIDSAAAWSEKKAADYFWILRCLVEKSWRKTVLPVNSGQEKMVKKFAWAVKLWALSGNKGPYDGRFKCIKDRGEHYDPILSEITWMASPEGKSPSAEPFMATSSHPEGENAWRSPGSATLNVAA